MRYGRGDLPFQIQLFIWKPQIEFRGTLGYPSNTRRTQGQTTKCAHSNKLRAALQAALLIHTVLLQGEGTLTYLFGSYSFESSKRKFPVLDFEFIPISTSLDSLIKKSM
jgi:hypothetical protein